MALSRVSSQDTSVLEKMCKYFVIAEDLELRRTDRELSVLAGSTVAPNRMAINLKLVCEHVP